MSTLFLDRDVDVVRLTLKSKTGGADVSYDFSSDYWAAAALSSEPNPVVYPLLAEPVEFRRAFRNEAAARYSPSIKLYGKTHFTSYGVGLADLEDTYAFHGATIQLLYFPKPSDATATYSATTSPVATLEVTGHSYDDATGVLTLQATDVWFKNKEFSRKFLATDFGAGGDDRYAGEYGATPLGEATTAANGVIISAPIIRSAVDGSSQPVADIFCGWVPTGHTLKAFQRLLVQNQHKEQDPTEWLQVELPADPQAIYAGSMTGSGGPSYPTAWQRQLSRYARAIVVSPGTNAVILTAVRTALRPMLYDQCADIDSGEYFQSERESGFSAGDSDLSIEIWVRFDAVAGASPVYVLQQGSASASTAEWSLTLPGTGATNNKPTFTLYTSGTTAAKTAVWGSAVSTGNWYHIACWHDSAGDVIGISVNNGTAVTTATGGAAMARGSDYFYLGSIDGRAKGLRYWDRVLSSTERTSLYNSAVPVLYDELGADILNGLRGSIELNEPYGIRADSNGSNDLREMGYTTGIGFQESNRAITVTNEHGDLQCNIYHCEYVGASDTWAPVGSALRRAVLDVGSSNVQAGSDICYFQIEPPLVMSADANYMIELDYTNNKTNTYDILCSYGSSGGAVSYARDKRGENQGWQKQTDVNLTLALYVIGTGTGFDASAGTYGLEAKAITLSGNQTRALIADLNFKVGVSGIADTGAGTFTGVASAVLSNPADIIHFLVRNNEKGAGLDVSKIDTTSITAVAASLAAAGLTIGYPVEEQARVEELILKICRQARIVCYKTSLGKFALNYPTYAGTFTYLLDQGVLCGDLLLLDYADNDYADIVNDFDQFYNLNPLEQPLDPAFVRRAEDQKKTSRIFLNGTDSSSGDTQRESLLATSQTLYQKREMREALDMYDSETKAQKVQNYYADRFAYPQKRATVRLPRRKYYTTLDLFATLSVRHAGIKRAGGTTESAKLTNGTASASAYNEGVPVSAEVLGALSGVVVEVAYQGPWIFVTVETQSSF